MRETGNFSPGINFFMENSDSPFCRLSLLLGKQGFFQLRNSFVGVVGLGAVGSYVTEALARAGVGKLRLVDYDVIKPSNMNRQLFALQETIGQKKCEVAAKRVASINPECQTEILDLFVHKDSVQKILLPDQNGLFPDMVVDAIDSLNPKIELIVALSNSGVPFISSMGAALRTDPTKIELGLLTHATYCPLAAILRKHLRRRGISTDFPCVYSKEPVRMTRHEAIASPDESEDNYYPKGRKRRSLGSLPTLTGIFGLIIANEVILKLSKFTKIN